MSQESSSNKNKPDESTDKTIESLSPAEFQNILKTLTALVDNPKLLASSSQEDRINLMKAAGRLSHPILGDNRRVARAARKIKKEEKRAIDRAALDAAGIRAARQKAIFVAPHQLLTQAPPLPQERKKLITPKNCYVCKVDYTEVHPFYDSMCPECADLNYQKRFQSASLEGRTALVTGGRVKIGYQTSLKLLRAGARTIVCTRFPNDSALRFSREEDFGVWKHRLQIYGLDLRHSPSVEMFARYLANTEERLDILVNNAAQTVRKPPGFYHHLMEFEAKLVQELPPELRPLLSGYDALNRTLESKRLSSADPNIENTLLKNWPEKNPAIGIHASAKLSMIPYNFDEETQTGLEVFPQGKLDADLQQVDLRSRNTWRLTLHEVATAEMLEVHLVNAVAPYILTAKLKPLMLRHTTGQQHIVNASAMEGKFTRWTKTDKHPHTNMAKAALNMMTLTSAPDFAKNKIYMNAVDTGWITDEDPVHLSAAKKEMHDFEPPLDIVDGAARLLDPVFSGLLTGEHMFGKFLKDYKPTEW